MDRRRQIRKYDFQVLDEPQRAASSRTWQDEPQNILAEDLMASNRYIKPALFPTPLNAMIDNRIFDISTSQVVIPRLAIADIYYLDRSQLDRKKGKVRTPKLGNLTFDKPNPELWHTYCKMFDEYYEQRNRKHIDRVKAIQKQGDKVAPSLDSEDLVALVMEDPQKFIGRTGSISPSKVMSTFKVPYNRAQSAATDATAQLEHRKTTEKAEDEAG